MIYVMWPTGTAYDESRGQFAEGEVGIGLNDLEPPVVELLLVFTVYLFGPLAIGGPRRSLMADSIKPDVRPKDIASLEQAHFVVIPPFCWFSIQRTT